MERMSDLSNTILDPVTTEWYPGVNMLDLSEENILLTSQASIVPEYQRAVGFVRDGDTGLRCSGKLFSFLPHLNLRNLKTCFLHLSKEIDKYIHSSVLPS